MTDLEFDQHEAGLRHSGFRAFFLSGMLSITSGAVAALLRDRYGFSFAFTGTLLSLLSIGNAAANFLTGILPAKLGTRRTVLLFAVGYCLAYFLVSFGSQAAVLALAFTLIGCSKGSGLNTCTLLANHSKDKTKTMVLLHAFFALGALSGPFVLSALTGFGAAAPTLGLSALGLIFFLNFMFTDFSEAQKKAGSARESAAFLRSPDFWLLTALVFCQNAAEQSVNGWLVSYFRDEKILSGLLSAYTLSIMWGATLVGRLLLAFVIPVKNRFRALTIMGVLLSVGYALLLFSTEAVSASLLLFFFAAMMAGVNPIAVAAVGRNTSAFSIGILLPTASLGAVIMPWVTGIAADRIGLHDAMAMNLLPCLGIILISFILQHRPVQN